MAAVATAETEPTLLLERIAAFARQDRVQAGSLIVTVFGDAVLPRGARLWLGSLIELLAPLGINERLVRTAVYRLVQEGWLTTRAHGRRTSADRGAPVPLPLRRPAHRRKPADAPAHRHRG